MTAAAADPASGASTGELELLRESAARFCAPEAHVGRSRRLRGTDPGFDRSVWNELAGLGWLGMLVPESRGGLGLGLAELAVVCEAAGRALLPEPLVAGVVLGAGALLHGDNEALKAELLPRCVDGSLLPALAWREDGHESDILTVGATAQAAGDTIRLAGTKRLVMAGTAADGYVVTAREAAGTGLYWVPRAQVAAAIRPVELADGRAAADVTLDGVAIPRAHRVAAPGAAEAILERIRDEALVAMSAELYGVAARTLEISLEYLRTRSQFGRLIGSYQGLQHRAVDLYAAQFMSRCTLAEVLDRTAGPLEPAARGALASRVKARCADSALRVTREAVQFHGAMGFSDECDIGLYLKRALTLSAWLGGPDAHRRRYAQLAATDEEAGA